MTGLLTLLASTSGGAYDELLPGIAASIVAATLLGWLAYRFKQPPILAFIAAGFLIGPSSPFHDLRLVTDLETVAVISELGLVLLLFIIGLEMDIGKLAGSGRVLLFSGVSQFLLCAGIGGGAFYLLGFRYGVDGAPGGKFALGYIAAAFALSSTTVVVKLLHDRRELHLLTGRITLGILIFQDLWAMVVLALQPSLNNPQLGTLGLSFFKGIVVALGAWYIGRPLLARLLRPVAMSSELLLLAALSWCFLLCALAQRCGLSVEMGALIAGVVLGALPYHVEIMAKVQSLRDFFLTLFFVSLGMKIAVPTLHTLELAAIATALCMVSRLLTVTPVLYSLGLGLRTSILPAINLSQISEFSLVIVTLGLSYGHVDSSLLSLIIITFVMTATLSSYAIGSSHNLTASLITLLKKIGVRDLDSADKKADAGEHGPTQRDVVFLGFYREASAIIEEWRRTSDREWESWLLPRIRVIDFNPEHNRRLKEAGVDCLYGDISNDATLSHADLAHAKVVVSSVDDSLLRGIDNSRLLAMMKKQAPDAAWIVKGETIPSALSLYEQGADFVSITRLHSAEFVAGVILDFMDSPQDSVRKEQIDLLQQRREILP